MKIHDLRFVERSILTPEHGDNVYRKVKVLQFMHAGGQWEDVPLVEEATDGKI